MIWVTCASRWSFKSLFSNIVTRGRGFSVTSSVTRAWVTVRALWRSGMTQVSLNTQVWARLDGLLIRMAWVNYPCATVPWLTVTAKLHCSEDHATDRRTSAWRPCREPESRLHWLNVPSPSSYIIRWQCTSVDHDNLLQIGCQRYTRPPCFVSNLVLFCSVVESLLSNDNL